MSFEFMVPVGGDRFERRGDVLTRIVSDAIIREISVVTFPAYPTTSAKVARRALQAVHEQGRSIAWLRQWHTAREV
jgi:phage head maturation protease